MGADAGGRHLGTEEQREALARPVLGGQHRRRRAARLGRQVVQPLAEQLEGAAGAAAHRFVERALVQGRERLGRERRMVGRRRGERDVQLGGALAEQAHRGQVGADALVELGRRVVAAGGLHQLEQRPRRHRRRAEAAPPPAGADPLEVAPEGVEREAPGIALVGDEPLQHGQGRRLAAAAAVAQVHPAGDRRHVAEVGRPGQVAADLEVGIDARLELAEQLEHQPVAVADRGVALLGAERPRLELGGAGAGGHRLGTGELLEAGVGPGRHLVRRAAEAAPGGHRRQQAAAEGGIFERVVEHAGRRPATAAIAAAAAATRATPATPGNDPRHDAPGLARTGVAGGERQRQGVALGLALPVADVEQQQPGAAVERDGFGQGHRAQDARLGGEPPEGGQAGGQRCLEGCLAGSGEEALPIPGGGGGGAGAGSGGGRRRRRGTRFAGGTGLAGLAGLAEDAGLAERTGLREHGSLGERAGQHHHRHLPHRHPAAGRRAAARPTDAGRLALEREPVERVRSQGERVTPVGGDRREPGTAVELDGRAAGVRGEVELDRLDEPRQVGRHQQRLVLVAAQEDHDVVVVRLQELQAAAGEGAVAFAQRDQPPRPPQQRVRVALLGLDVDRLVVELGVGDHR